MSNEDLNQEIKFVADASGVKSGVSEIKRELGSIGPAADKAGAAGAAGLNKIGAGGEAAARKMDSVTKNMVASLQRQIAAFEAGGTATREYQESIARMRGADLGALKPYLDQLDAAKRKANDAADATKSLGAAATLARGAIASALAGLTVGSVAGFVRSVNDGVDALNDIKDATGSSIENISALEDVALRAGASMDVVSSAMIKFNQVLADAKPGSAQELALKAIGLSAEELRRLDPAEALRQTAVALSQYADDGNKARLVQELFGKSIKEAAPFLNDLAEKGRLVATVSAEQAAEAEKFNKQLAEMSKNATDVARSLVGPMVTSINEVIKKFKEGRAAGQGFMAIGWQNYKDGVREFWTGEKPSTGGATGSWGEPEQTEKPSVGNVPDPAAMKAQADAARKASEQVRKELSEQAKLMAELSGLTGSFAEDWARLTAVFTDKTGVVNVEALTAAQAELLKKQPFMAATAKAEADARRALIAVYQEQVAIQEELNAAYVADSRAREAGRAAVSDYARGIQESADALEFELSLMGQTEEARRTAIEHYRIELDLKKQIEAIDRNTGFNEAEREEERARARAAAATARLTASTRVAMDESRRMAESIQGSLTDALMRGFESGKDFAANFRDTLLNMFKTLVLRPVISFIVNPISSAVSSVIGGVVNNGLSMLGLGNNLFGGGGSILGNIGSAVGSWLGLGGAATGLGLSAGVGGSIIGAGIGSGLGIGAGAAATGTGLGLTLGGTGLGIGAGSAGASTIGAGIGSSLGGGAAAGGGISGALAAVPAWGWALAAVAVLASLADSGETRVGGQFGVAYDGEVDNNRRGETYTYEGQQYDRDFSGGARNPLIDGQAYRLEGDPVENEQLIRDAVAGTARGINETLKALGSAVTVTGFSAGLETSGKGRGGVFAGGTLSNGVAFGESGQGDNYAGTLYELTSTNSPDYETALKNFTLDLKQSTIQALQAATDIPESVKKMIEDVDAEALSDEAANALLSAINTQIAGVTAFRDALGNMGLEDLAGIAYDVAVAVAEASGGFEALGSNMTSFWQNYFTPEEREAAMRDRVTEALAEVGLEMPATREEFRALVLELLAMGEEGAAAAAVLLSVNDEFAALTEGAASAAEALGITAGGLAGIMGDAVRNSSSRGEAEEKASQGFEEAFYGGVLDTMTSALSEGLMSAVLGPLLNGLVGGAIASGTSLAIGGAAGGGAVAAGGAVAGGAVAAGGAAAGGAVASGGAQAGAAMAAGGEAAGGRITDFITSAREYISQFMAVLGDPGVQGAIGEFAGMFGNITGDLYEGMNTFFINSKSMPAVSGGLSSAMGGVADAMKDLTDALIDEVRRLRGLMQEDSPVLQDVLMSQFATATAQARAGDKDALAKLPQLSQAIEAAAQITATSAVDLARLRGWLAGSLEETLKARGVTVPKLAVGTNYVPQDMLAYIHKGEAVVPERYNPAAGMQVPMLQVMQGPHQGQEQSLLEEVRSLRSEVVQLREQLDDAALDAQRLRMDQALTAGRIEQLIAMK
ncbi:MULTISPECIES: hypothetical protein [unclassified Acidovorax]|uniref:hypothetical protein n=1 Tax=unclassified Acidovorax TaxID=2684926 RepID=UPI001C471ADD|nr:MULTISPECIES: hypothetical protein [unclassified Acidovorax]MBV7459849.1 hypothetical protein [Acidovorax sp. sif0632]MBV7464874.1 hypothetical protein [Acidovorax sp. sif0613]